MPTLDAKLSMIYKPVGTSSHVSYTYFEKEMNTCYVTLETSAMCPQEKLQTLSQEVVRRLSRVDDTRPGSEKIMILDKFSEKLQRSGYSVKQMRHVITSGIRCYRRKVEKAKS